jgi:hypothetical protein
MNTWNTCKICGNAFTGHHRRRYCSDECRRQGVLESNHTFYKNHPEKHNFYKRHPEKYKEYLTGKRAICGYDHIWQMYRLRDKLKSYPSRVDKINGITVYMWVIHRRVWWKTERLEHARTVKFVNLTEVDYAELDKLIPSELLLLAAKMLELQWNSPK